MRKEFWIILGAVIFLGAVWIASNAFKYKYKQQETISVTGAADTNFVADIVAWSASFSRTSYDLQEAYSALKGDENQVKDYLIKLGLADNEVIMSAISIDKLYDYQYDQNGNQRGSVFNGYKLTQNVKVKSDKIDKVDLVSRKITELIQKGLELNSSAPSYYYSKLESLKIDLLAKASADARKRASTIAKNADASLGCLKKASMGIFQITGQFEDEDYTYGGTFNTSSLNKTASITVKQDYDIN